MPKSININRANLVQFAKFLLAGVVNTCFGYLFYTALLLANLPQWLVVAGSTAMGAMFNFVSYGRMVFANMSMQRLPRFLGFYSALGFVNYVLLKLLDAMQLGPLIAQALLLPVLAVLAYAGMRCFVFTTTSGKVV